MKKLCSAVIAALVCATLHGAGIPFEMTGQIMIIADTSPRRLHILTQDLPAGCSIWDLTKLKAKYSSGDIVTVQGFQDKPTGTILREVPYPVANYVTNIIAISHAEFPKTVFARPRSRSAPARSAVSS